MSMERDTLRRVTLRPYRPGLPHFSLHMWATTRQDHRGQTVIGYELRQHAKGAKPVTIFAGEDFAGSPMHADDADETVAALLGFLTLRPGDTDADYFETYTPEQLDFCAQHAEALSLEALTRFGED